MFCPGLLKALASNFETWFIWINLLGIYVYGMYGMYSKPDTAPFRTAIFRSVEHERISYSVGYLLIVLTGFIASIMDAFQKSPIGTRIRAVVLVWLLASMIRVMVLDRIQGDLLWAEPVWFLYQADTRSLVLQCMQNAVLFFGYGGVVMFVPMTKQNLIGLH